MRRATKKQLALINKIEWIVNKKFEGETVSEASEFISANILEYQVAIGYAHSDGKNF